VIRSVVVLEVNGLLPVLLLPLPLGGE